MTSPSSPLRISIYRSLWIATVVSNIGTWMNDVAAGWLMTSLSDSPLMVALIQAATTFPLALLALPGGALADIVDRRRLLLGAQTAALLVAGALFGASFTDRIDANGLLILVFLLACSSAVSAPTYQSIISEIVPRESIPQAVALGGLGVNIARAVGPAIGGLLLAAAGPAWVFLLNGLTYCGTIAVLAGWQRQAPASGLPREQFIGAIRAGVRYLSGSVELRTVTVRATGLFLFASATWSLLPLLARRTLGLNATQYGLMLGCIGVGAIVGAVGQSRLKTAGKANKISVSAAMTHALGMAGLAMAQSFLVASLACFALGVSWILIMATLQSAVQLNAPAWVKARALGVFLFAFQGSMALGAVLWGAVAGMAGVRSTITVAATMLGLFQLLAFRFKLSVDPDRDLSPGHHWPMPVLTRSIDADLGPVMVTVEYRVRQSDWREFISRINAFGITRRRDGAIRWNIWQATDDPECFIECFIVESWLEHLRQHERVTQADRALQQEIDKLNKGRSTIVRHWIATDPAVVGDIHDSIATGTSN